MSKNVSVMKAGWNKMTRVAVVAVCLWTAMPQGYAGGNAAQMERFWAGGRMLAGDDLRVGLLSRRALVDSFPRTKGRACVVSVLRLLWAVWNAKEKNNAEQLEKAERSKRERTGERIFRKGGGGGGFLWV